jgi:hypothetical protein
MTPLRRRLFLAAAAALGLLLGLAAQSLAADRAGSGRSGDRNRSNRADNPGEPASRSNRASTSDNSSRSEGFDRYRLIVDRNIFDPSRRASARNSESDDVRDAREPAETIDLLGTWITDRQALAFVEGSRSELTGAPAQGESLAGWRIVAVRGDRVTLERDGKRLDWPIGKRIERRADGRWTLSGDSVLSSKSSSASSSSSSAASSPSSSTSASSSSAPASSGSAEDLLRQMRERRQRENNP